MAELEWWKAELGRYRSWFDGSSGSLWGVAPPTSVQKRSGATPEERAVRTFLALTIDRYPTTLGIEPNRFAGRRVLDLGCGPLPYSLAFTDCEIVALDPLIEEYRAAGFPLDSFSDRIDFFKGFAEQMPFTDRSFDAIICVNAIDHVDDLEATAREIARVVRSGGELWMQVHYHEPTLLEPQAIDDRVMSRNFGALGMAKINERVPEPDEAFQPANTNERLVIWAAYGAPE
jgi:SAM-dependent methyltransferase